MSETHDALFTSVMPSGIPVGLSPGRGPLPDDLDWTEHCGASMRGVASVVEGVAHQRRLEAFADMQYEVLGMILERTPLEETLLWIARRMMEGSEDGMLCSIFVAAADGTHLRLAAAPGLPADYNSAINPLPVGDGIGSCGTAAARGEMVVVEDTWVHPDWKIVRNIVRRYPQLRACWSMPVKSSGGKVLGTMGMYHSVTRSPRPEEVRWAQAAARLTGLAIERTEETLRLKETGAWLTTMLESLDDAFFTLDREWRFVTLNRQTGLLLQRPPASLVGRIIWEEFKAAAGTGFEANCRAALEDGKMRVIEEFRAASKRWLEVRIHPSAQGVAIHFRDVTAARKAAQALRESEARFKLAAKATADALWDVDIVKRTVWWSEGLERLFGHTPEEAGSDLDWWIQRVHPEDREGILNSLEESWKGQLEDDPWAAEYRFQRKDGSWANVTDRGYLIRDVAGQPARMVGGITDVTERRRIEREARESAAMQVRIAAVQREITGADLTLQAVLELVADRARRLVAADGAVVGLIEGQEVVLCAASGLAAMMKEQREPLTDSLAGQCVREGRVLSCADTRKDARVNAAQCARTGVRSLVVAPLRSGKLDVGVLQLFSLQPGAFAARDSAALEILAESLGAVIQNHLTASRLKSSEAQYRLLFDHNPHPMWAYEVQTHAIMEVNEAALKHYGYSREEFLAMRMDDLLVAGTVRTAAAENGEQVQQHRNRAGEVMEVEISSEALTLNDREARLVLAHDVTERQRSARELARLHRAQLMRSACTDALYREEEELSLLKSICRVAVEIGSYQVAWIGYVQQDAACSIQPVASHGVSMAELDLLKLSWAENVPGGQGPAGVTVRSGEVYVCEDIANHPDPLVWRQHALAKGYRSIVCLPLRKGGVLFGLMVLWSGQARALPREELQLLTELADDTAGGAMALRMRVAHVKLQEAVVKVAASVSAASGTEFFQNLALSMADALGATVAGIARRIPGPTERFRIIACVREGKPVPEFEYTLDGSPCGGLLQADEYVIPAGLAGQFPGMPNLAEWGAQAYVGRLLRDAEGGRLGAVYLLFKEPVTDAEFVASSLRIFSIRAATELQRQDDDARIRQQASLLDKASDAIVVRDMEHRITFWNQGAERLYGWSEAEAEGCSLTQLLHVPATRMAEAFSAVLDTGEWTGVLEKTARDGSAVVVDSRWTLLRDAEGAPRSILSLDTDITEKHRLDQQFLRAQRMESIGTLAGGIAHDLNNVLAPIMMSIDLLKQTLTDPLQQEVLGTIAQSARRGAAMVGQVLSFARGVETRRVPVSPRAILTEISKIAGDTFPKHIRILTELPETLWMVEGDHTQLHQVLLNLCVNARDAMSGSGLITLGASNLTLDAHYAGMNLEARPGPYVLISVEDNGSGIPPEIVEKIFDPFFTTKETGKGTGLGLSTSMAIIRSHGGFVRVYSEPGKGSCFRLYLPALPDTQEVAEIPSGAGEEMPRGNGELILVIDDESAIARITQQTLERFGYTVVVAVDGAEGVTLYAENAGRIAAVITDMMMPVMDGASTIHVLTRMNPKVRIIAASGINANRTPSRTAGAGAREFLTKPYTAPTLLQALRRVLDLED